MDGTDKNISNNENQSTREETNNTLNNEKRQEISHCNDDAGPSTTLLPGTVQNSKFNQLKPGISKSEHSLRHIITTQDVANALKSLSFNTRQPTAKLDVKEFKIPVSLKEDNAEEDSTSFIDLKKLMASCFKFNKDVSNAIILGDVPNIAVPNIQTVRPVISTIINETNATNTIVQTETISAPINTNEVIVTNIIEPKQSKSSKKKVSNLSEKSDLGLAQRDSLSSIGSNVCRICMTKGKERLISPCHCKGSLANVHLSCLERWLNQVGRHHCELCGFSYPAIRTPRYTVLQALRLWFGNPRNRSHLQSDCLIFWLLSTVTAGLLAVCIVGTQYFAIEGSNFGKLDARKEEGISHRITETAMDFFMAIVLCGYSVTVYLLWKDHYVMWNRWRRANVNVRLLLTPDANPVPFLPRSGYTVV